jgi:hypothetical protein
MRDLSLERNLPIKEQQYQSTKVKPTQPPTVPQEYYGTIINRHSQGIE